MSIVVDASVAVKWLIREADSDKALAVLEEGLVTAPDLVLAEVGNATWKLLRMGIATSEQVAVGLPALPRFFNRLIPSAQLLGQAFEAAKELDHPIYDCFYLAAADRIDALLVTADRRLVAKVAGTRWNRVRVL